MPNLCGSRIFYQQKDVVESSDVKRGQNLEAKTEAEARALRLRPELWGQDRGQFLDVEAKPEAKKEVMNKKYQMMIDNIQANL